MFLSLQMAKELGDLKKLKSITFNGCENLEGTVFLPPGIIPSANLFGGCAKLDSGGTLKRYMFEILTLRSSTCQVVNG